MRAGAVGALGAAAALAVAVYAWPGADGGDRPGPAAPVKRSIVTIPVGEGPSEVAVGHGAIWVSNTGDDSVTRIDPDTNAVQATIPLEGEPGDLAVDWGGDVWVAIREAGVVQKIDGTTNDVTPIRVEVGSGGAALDLAVEEHLWVSAVEVALVQVDVESGAILSRNEELRPVNVAARDGGVFALDADGVVRGVSPDTGEASSLEIAFDVEGRGDVHFYSGHLWVAQGDGNKLFSIPVVGSDTVARYPFRGTYMEMVHGEEGVLVLSDLGNETAVLSLIDPDDGDVRELAELQGRPRDLVRGAEDLWVSNETSGTVTRLRDIP